MGEKDQVPFEDDDFDSYDDFDDELDPDEEPEGALSSPEQDKAYSQQRINARHEIERRAALKALRDELDEWDELDEDDI